MNKKYKSPRRSGKPGNHGTKLPQKILHHFKKHGRKRYNAKQLARKLKLKNSYAEIEDVLRQLERIGKIKKSGDGTYKFVKAGKSTSRSSTPRHISQNELIGRLDMTRRGDAYVVVEGLEEDIFVQGRHSKFALHGDTVRVEIRRTGRKVSGVVTEIVERKRDKFLGKLSIENGKAFVETEDARLFITIEIPTNQIGEAKEGDMVTVGVTRWPESRRKFPVGKVLHVLGAVGSHEIEMQQILLNQGFDPAFADEVLREAEALQDGALDGPSAERKDYRSVTTFTIDPDTARDFDDALSYKQISSDLVEIGIHIADVTHYIRPGTPLDKEAYQRSTSVYLVDRVAPMLPERLSNELCSLRPNEDKCTFSAIFTFDSQDQIVKKWFGKTLTHSDRRFTYEEAQEILEGGRGEFSREIKKLNRLAEKMRRERFKKGAINFESAEVKFKLDDQGTPLEVYVKERKAAHMLVEEFMLLANREVANFIVEKSKDTSEIPFVYRVHDYPDPDRVEDFARFAKELGIRMDTSTPATIAKSFNMVQKASESVEGLRMLGPMAIRTMAKAIYTTDNIGHYGLAFDNYAHFTSPIRRYADVLVHRILEKNLRNIHRFEKPVLESMCKHISAQEKKAAEAERESVKFKLVEFMESRVGQVFEGYITGFIERGIFVELAGVMAEGMIGFNQFTEYFTVAESRLKAVGNRTGKIFKMGDKIKVKVLEVDLSSRQIELEFMN